MTDAPRISVIIPSRDHGEYLERAICSVIDQGVEAVELIVVDGGSIDNSRDVLKLYSHELTWWTSEPDTGAADAINKGLGHASGELVVILDADDVLLPGALEMMAHRFAQPDRPAWAIGSCIRIDHRDDQIGIQSVSLPGSLKDFLSQTSGAMPAAARCYRRDVLEQVGRFNTGCPLAYDFELAARLLSHGHAPAPISAIVAAKREHSESRSANHALALGEQMIDVIESHSTALPLPDRLLLGRDCDQRRLIYVLARRESSTHPARAALWRQLLRRPDWLARDPYRAALLEGAQSTAAHDAAVEPDAQRRAA